MNKMSKNDGTNGTSVEFPCEIQNLIKFIVTGFGPFNGAQDNPTTILANEIVGFLQGRNDDLANNTSTLVIETSAEAARAAIDMIAEQIKGNGSRNMLTVIIHLGVNNKGTKFELEQYAYNEATFRVPDERGYLPHEEDIVAHNHHDFPVGEPLKTILDVPDLVNQLSSLPIRKCEETVNQEDNNDGCPLVVSSDDPGRFVCNYTYCYSLDKFECSESHQMNTHSIKTCSMPLVRCLFMHVPPFTVVPQDQQLETVANLMDALQQQLEKEK